MSLDLRTLASAAAAVLLSAATTAADPIQITAGSLVWRSTDTNISVTLAGEGFTFSGATNRTEGLFMPVEQCIVPECRGGTTVDLQTYFLGHAFSGTATLNGTTYTRVGSLNSTSSIETQWTGSMVIPDGFTGGALFAPFTFQGQFAYQVSPTQPGVADLFGSGTAALTFSPYGNAQFPGALALDAVSYNFEAAAPTPEPASLLLMGTGLCAIAAARRRRARARP